MGFNGNSKHITIYKFFFNIFSALFSSTFIFISVLTTNFFVQSTLSLYLCSVISLSCQSNSTLAPCWIRKSLIQRFAVLCWQAGSQSFLFESNPMHYFKSDRSFLPESLHQHNVSLFSHLSHPLPLHVLLHSQASACCSEVSWQWASSPAGRGITVSQLAASLDVGLRFSNQDTACAGRLVFQFLLDE